YANDTRQLQEWAISVRQYFENQYYDLFREAEIVCCRGVLTTIAKTPYYKDDTWRLVAVKQDGIIYLHDCGAVDGRTFASRNEWDARSTYWGHHFPRCMTKVNDGRKHVVGYPLSDIVDSRETDNGVFRSDLILPDLSRIKLTYSAEIKAVDHYGNYVDFRTIDKTKYEMNTYLTGSWVWWMQCHFVGINRIFLGLKEGGGVVDEVKVVERTFLKAQSARECDVAMTFLATVLKKIKNTACVQILQIRYCPMKKKIYFEVATKDTDFLLQQFV
ncbi:hypothetical protein PENTCL1PPCAC_369, partial [Pristionchus entomophagus]